MRLVALSVALALPLLQAGSSIAAAQAPALAAAPAPVAVNNIRFVGELPRAAWVGDPYAFRPTIYVRDGRTPTRFGAINAPQWASLAADGTLSGTPGPGDVGGYPGIYVVAYIGTEYAILGPFSIEVRDPATSPRVTLKWAPPRQNTDGTPLTDLRGYSILAARQGRLFEEVKRVGLPGITRVVIDRLEPGVWFFQVKALTSVGIESEPSALVWKPVK